MSNVIRIKRGDTMKLLCKLANEMGEIEVLDNSYTIKMQVRKGVDKELVWDFAENGGIVKLTELDAQGNNLLISATASQTASMPAGRYVSDVEIEQNGEVHTLPGVHEEPLTIEIIGDITK